MSRIVLPDSYRLELHDRLGSTMDAAMTRARAGDPGGLWIVAREQESGRGRHGRNWVSPAGNLYASLLLIDPGPTAVAPQLGFVAGVALTKAASDFVRHDRRLAIKWPNDLLFARAKLAGVLLESACLADGRSACVIGFGVNCRSHPSGLPYPATDFAAIGRAVDPLDALERLALQIAEWLVVWDQGRGFAKVREAWLSFAAGLGETIRVEAGALAREGRFGGLDAEGRLLLANDAGVAAIEVGDVFLSNETGRILEGNATP